METFFNTLETLYVISEFQIVFWILGFIFLFTKISTKKLFEYDSLNDFLCFLSLVILINIYFTFSLYSETTQGSLFLFNGSLIYNDLILLIKQTVLLGTLIIIYLSNQFLKSAQNTVYEYYLFFLFLLLGGFIAISANDFLFLIIGLELQTLTSYILLSTEKKPTAIEASLKYFLINSFASTLFIFSFSIIFFILGVHNFSKLELLIQTDLFLALSNFQNILLYFGIILFCLSFLIKLGVAPFHFWVPDVYAGAPLPLALYLSTLQKFITFFVFIKICLFTFQGFFLFLIKFLFLIFAFLSFIFGSLTTSSSLTLKRFFAFSSLNHLGFILLGASLGSFEGLKVSITYFIIYLITSFSVWLSVLFLQMKQYVKKKYKIRYITNLKDISIFTKNSMTNTSIFIINVFSVAGMPPLLGFFPKLFVINSILNDSSGSPESFQLSILTVAILSTFYSSFYYSKLLINLFLIRTCSTYTKEYTKEFKLMHFGLVLFFTQLNLFGVIYFPLIVQQINYLSNLI